MRPVNPFFAFSLFPLLVVHATSCFSFFISAFSVPSGLPPEPDLSVLLPRYIPASFLYLCSHILSLRTSPSPDLSYFPCHFCRGIRCAALPGVQGSAGSASCLYRPSHTTMFLFCSFRLFMTCLRFTLFTLCLFKLTFTLSVHFILYSLPLTVTLTFSYTCSSYSLPLPVSFLLAVDMLDVRGSSVALIMRHRYFDPL